MRTVVVKVDEKEFICRALRSGHELWLHFNGETHIVDLRPKKNTGSHSSTESTGEIIAPMPGKILKVPCKVGDQVNERDVLVIMEAMKMEYTLSAPFAGVVRQVTIKIGDQVELNQLLVKVEKK